MAKGEARSAGGQGTEARTARAEPEPQLFLLAHALHGELGPVVAHELERPRGVEPVS